MPRVNKGENNGGLAIAEQPDELIEDLETTEATDEVANDSAEPVAEDKPKSLGPPEGPVIEYREDPTTARIAALAQEAKDYEDAETDYKEKAKAAKACKEKAIAEMRRLGEKYGQPTMFDGQQSDQSIAACPPPFGADEGGVAVMEKADPEPWRSVSVQVLVDDYSLPKRTFDALVDAGLDTIGKIADYTSRGKLLIDIKGISNAGVENIEQAMSDFWAVYLVESTPPDDTPFEPEDEDEDDDSEE